MGTVSLKFRNSPIILGLANSTLIFRHIKLRCSLDIGIIGGCSYHLANIRLMSKHGLIQLNLLERGGQLESAPWTG